MRYSSRVLEPSSSRARGPQSSLSLQLRRRQTPSSMSSSAPSFAPLREYIIAVIGVAALTVACWLLTPLTGYGAISLIFLLGVLLAGMVLNRGPVLLVAALSALSWNFLFIPPLFTLHIAKFEDALTFATYFIIAITVGSLTAQLKAREHLAAQVQLAQESERLRKTLLDCVSHELKTPLAAIGGGEPGTVSPDGEHSGFTNTKQLAGEIHDGSHRLNRVVNNLLDMNRLESGVIRPKQRMVRRARTTPVGGRDRARIDQRSRYQAGRAGRNSFGACGSYLDRAGGGKASRQCRKSYRRPICRSKLMPSTRTTDLLISVSDRGPGIPPEAAERVFEKFYRGDNRKTGGLGLGLSIARGFVEAHGGKTYGRESRWRRRTLHHQPASSRNGRERYGNDFMKSARSALIIDDEKQIRRLLRLALEGADHQVYEAETGQAGLAEIVHRRPDMVLLDLGLPDMDGLKVLRRLREWSDVPVLILSVRDDAGRKGRRPRRRGGRLCDKAVRHRGTLGPRPRGTAPLADRDLASLFLPRDRSASISRRGR